MESYVSNVTDKLLIYWSKLDIQISLKSDLCHKIKKLCYLKYKS